MKLQGAIIPATVSCRWRLSETSGDADTPQYFHCLDLILSVYHGSSASPGEGQNGDNGSTALASDDVPLEYLVGRCFDAGRPFNVFPNRGQGDYAPARLLSLQTDILELRMRHSELIESVIQFPSPNRHLFVTPAILRRAYLCYCPRLRGH